MCLSSYYLKFKEVNWKSIFTYFNIQFDFVCHNILCRVLYFILRCCLFVFFPYWIRFWYISLSASDIVLYQDSMPWSGFFVGRCTTVNWNISDSILHLWITLIASYSHLKIYIVPDQTVIQVNSLPIRYIWNFPMIHLPGFSRCCAHFSYMITCSWLGNI